MKRVLTFFLAFLLVFLCGCSLISGLTVPDVVLVEEDIAKNVLSSNGLIPVTQYVYDDTVPYGCVVRTSPSIGSKIEKNSKITLYISKGPKFLQSKDSTISWYHISSEKDTWSFYSPYIDDGILYINCQVTFGADISWKNNGFGKASINDTFTKTVPITISHTAKDMKAGRKYEFTLAIPLNDLDVNKPTTMYLELIGLMDGEQKDINISFTMTW